MTINYAAINAPREEIRETVAAIYYNGYVQAPRTIQAANTVKVSNVQYIVKQTSTGTVVVAVKTTK